MAQVASAYQDQLAVAELLVALRVRLAGGEAATSEEEVSAHVDEDFMMYEFKVRRCPRSRAHEWTSCPYAHPGEAARRRDPRRVAYTGDPCPDFRICPGASCPRGAGCPYAHPGEAARRRDPRRVAYTGDPCPDFRICPGASCPRGAGCPFAHGTFELWLHPSRYRTRPCRSGSWCARPICFFAHNDKELRIVSDAVATLSPRSPSLSPRSLLTTWEYSPPLSPTDVKRQLQPVQQGIQPADQGNMGGMDAMQLILAMQERNARKAMRPVAPRTATLPQVMEEDESELGWVSDLLM